MNYRHSIRIVCATALLTIMAPVAWGAAITATWNTGVTDSWNNVANNAANWSFSTPPATAVFPTNSGGDTFAVQIDNSGIGNSTVNLNTSVTIDSLGVSGGDTLNFNNSFDMNVAAGTINNNGAINLTGTSSTTDLTLSGVAAAINGTGTITLGNSTANRILGTAGNIITQAAGHTIQGSGSVLNNVGGFSNQGTIIANQTTALTIDANDTDNFDNTSGTLRAASSGTLNLNSGTYTNTLGSIEATGVGSVVNLNGNSNIVGGNLTTTGGGQIRSNINGPAAPVLDGVTVTAGSNLVQNNQFDTIIRNGITNQGTWNLNGTSVTTNITFDGSQTIGGAGEIVMGNGTANQILSGNANLDTLTLGAGQTIRGAGNLLIGFGGMVNNGAIRQQGTVVLSIDPGTTDAGLGANFINNGTLIAEGTGGIVLKDGIYDNNTTIEAAVGSQVILNAGATIVGGNLTSTGTGQIRSAVNGSTAPVLDGVTVTAGSNLVQNNQFDTVIRNGITNQGTWNLNGTTVTTNITFDGSQTIDGAGEIVMSNSGANRIVSGNANVGTLTLGASQTIRGAGQLLIDFGGMVNNGTIRQQGTAALTIDPGNTDAGIGANFINNGTLIAEGTGGIDLKGGIYDNNTTIEAAAGSAVRLGASTIIVGGNLTSTGSGQIRSNATGSTAPVLDGVTVTAGSNLVQNNQFDTVIRNGITNQGTWNLNGTSVTTDINFDGSQTIGGAGEIVMGNSGANRILSGNANLDTLTLGAGQTIRGAGNLLIGFGGMVNNGAIRQQGTVALTIDPGTTDAGLGANFINNGTLIAEGTGGINLNSGIYDNNTTIEAAVGSQVILNAGATIVGGNLTSTGTGQIRSAVNGSTAPVLDGVTVTAGSNLVQNNQFDTVIRNGITNQGTWNLNGTTVTTNITFDGSQTIDGGGEIVMSNSGANRIVSGNANLDTLTLGASQTVRGAGQLLIGFGGMVNNGTIDATGTTAIFLNAGTPGFSNFGTLRASGTGGVDIISGSNFTQAGGLVDVQAASRLDVVAGNYVQTGGQTTINGVLTTASTGSTVELQGGRFGGTGTVNFNGSGAHAINNIAGTMAVGNSPGQLTITDGDYVQQAAASFEFELFGAVVGVSHDLLTILNGDADLSGGINILADQLFASTLTIGDQFEVIQLDTLGSFIGGNFFDTLTVDLTGLSFIQIFANNSLGGTSLFLEVVQADVNPPGAQVAEPGGLLIVLTGMGVMAFVRRRRTFH